MEQLSLNFEVQRRGVEILLTESGNTTVLKYVLGIGSVCSFPRIIAYR